MATIQSINLISTDPNVRGGRPVLAGTGIEVTTVAIAHIVHQQSPSEFAAHYDVSLAQVYAALAYYYAHKPELDALMEDRARLAAEFREQGFGRRPPVSG
jgi:uncharacterized protein (DUF433 family)